MSASVAFAVSDDNATVSEVDDEIAIDDGALTIADDSDALEVSDEAVVQENASDAGSSAVVTNATFSQYFDETGTLLDNVTSDELIFEGDFSGISADYITISKPIKFTGNDASFKNVTFIVAANNVAIDGFALSQSADVFAIDVQNVDNVTLSNNYIDFTALQGFDSFAIYASAVNNLKMINNTIAFVGTTTGSEFNNVIKGEKVNKADIKNNKFYITMPATTAGYDANWNSEYYSEGVVFIDSENIVFNENTVDIEYSNYSGSYDSINVLVFGNSNFEMDDDWNVIYPNVCKNVTVEDNVINAKGHNFIYGITMVANDSSIKNNVLNISSDYHYADGIQIGGPSDNIIVGHNEITLNAPDVVYGIYSYQYMGSITNIVYDANVIDATAYAVGGFETVENNPTIINNLINAQGNHTTGMVVNMIANGNIINNTINVYGSNVGNTSTGDSLIHMESTAISAKGDGVISSNSVYSTAIGVNLLQDGDIVLDNNTIFVKSDGITDNYALCVNDITSLNVTNNYIEFEGLTDGNTITNGVYITSTDNVNVKDNKFIISVPSAYVPWVNTPPGSYNWIPFPVSQGFVIESSKDAILENNNISVSYNNVSGSYDTIYAVAFRDVDNAVIKDNNIVASGHTYIYGIFISGDDFIIANNNIRSVSDVYYANGINPDAGASGIIENNTIVAIGVSESYPIYSNMYGSSDFNINYIHNRIYGNALLVVALDLGGANENVINNTIIAEGNNTVAIDAGSSNNVISGNIVRSLGTSESSLAIQVTKGNTTISENFIEAPAGDIAVNLVGSDSIVENNYIASKKSVGANAIANPGPLSVILNNTPASKVILVAPKVAVGYIEPLVLKAYLYDEYGDPISNATVFAMVNNEIYNQTTDADGCIAIELKLDAGSYDAVVTFYGNEKYAPKTVATVIDVEQSASEISAPSSTTVLLTAVKSGSYVKITLKNSEGILADKKVSITFNGKTKSYKTDPSGVVKFKLSATKTGTYTLKAKFAGDTNYIGSSSSTKVKINKESTKLTASKQTFKAKTKTKKYTVTLKDSKGKAIKKVKVTIKVKGKTYKATTNSKGKATFKITKLTKKGTYTAKVNFAGNTYYKSTTKSVKITVKK